MITVVVPTVGRPSLAATLAALDPGLDVIVVDDRPAGARTAPLPVPDGVRTVRSGGRGPAAARNAGWRAADTPWIAFLDDDVIPAPGWAKTLHADLDGLPAEVAGSQGRIHVPPPEGGRPTDDERATAGLARSRWITADMAYQREALERVGGFDERFPRAYREDADLALRVTAAGYRLVRGERVTSHPFRDDGPWASVRRQRGNADDALMRRLHGPAWRMAVGGGAGRLRRHALITCLGGLAVLAGALPVIAGIAGPGAPARGRASGPARGRGRAAGPVWNRGLPGVPGRAHGRRVLTPVLPERGRGPARTLARGVAAAAGAGWLALTAEFAWARIAPGPRTPAEIGRMLLTSVLIPPAACAHRLRGELRVRLWRAP
ncbi:glycosyltransferase family 2 protein [Streptosporangium sp. NPDC004379]|uniref:glycosyltransferase family 2 protein n=1 Tax=Streptosporangium sp. NPDC004379 TaxID=3366189 RepID=UPI00367AC160